ncbi:16061_t:CDS:1 [Acaulospora colombiana]|uniref:16061_t:CDS:1 n=1 Tax=Acaulospora colombiana TaxID=27376 RepID=A0ACA9LZV7_9GLOM|nr:16061_t:CDS:1 [Acaulospora colombiana]
MSTKEEELNTNIPSTTTSSIISSKHSSFMASNIAFQRTLSWSTASSSGEEHHIPYEEELVPPDNFTMISTWVYRSSFPKKKNFAFLKKLGLRSILYESPLQLTCLRLNFSP